MTVVIGCCKCSSFSPRFTERTSLDCKVLHTIFLTFFIICTFARCNIPISILWLLKDMFHLHIKYQSFTYFHDLFYFLRRYLKTFKDKITSSKLLQCVPLTAWWHVTSLKIHCCLAEIRGDTGKNCFSLSSIFLKILFLVGSKHEIQIVMIYHFCLYSHYLQAVDLLSFRKVLINLLAILQ